MTYIYYAANGEIELVCSVLEGSPRSNMWALLELCDVDMDDFSRKHGWDGWNPEELYETTNELKTWEDYLSDLDERGC